MVKAAKDVEHGGLAGAAMLQVRDIQRLTFDNVLSFYQSRVQGKPITILIMGDPKLIDQKQIQAKYGKITKLSKSRLFSN